MGWHSESMFLRRSDVIRGIQASPSTQMQWPRVQIGGLEEVSMNALAERINALTGGSPRLAEFRIRAYAPGFEDILAGSPTFRELVP